MTRWKKGSYTDICSTPLWYWIGSLSICPPPSFPSSVVHPVERASPSEGVSLETKKEREYIKLVTDLVRHQLFRDLRPELVVSLFFLDMTSILAHNALGFTHQQYPVSRKDNNNHRSESLIDDCVFLADFSHLCSDDAAPSV